MKKIFALAAVLLTIAACGGKDNPDTPSPTPGGGGGGGSTTKLDVTGSWELSGVETKVSVGSVNVSVYISFTSDGSFTLYQKIGEGRYSVFTGTYTLSSDNKLSGKYSNNAAWGPYTAALSGGKLTLTSAGGKEVDTYTKISSIPAAVSGNTY
ncbi:MAG: lipocalin family protein [Bacteroidales bacterium]|nr:lipocalin family protein [Bacteroidales bacterium]